MRHARIAIVGGGLSGLYAAFLLEARGIRDYVVLEARSTFGGRILSASAAGGHASNVHDRVDLGPTWYWPDLQPQLDQVIRDLGLESFPQHEDGDTVVERSPEEPPMRTRGYLYSPASMRVVGGMGALVAALAGRLDPARVLAGHAVRRVRIDNGFIDLDSEDGTGEIRTFRVAHVLLAMPPRLVAENIEFAPALPASLTRAWGATATWMAPHAKYVAVYDTPFWREQGLSGEARSARGPLAEIHDASVPGGSAALFGFLGVPARTRQGVPEDVLRAHCRAQLVRLFGPQAADPRLEIIKDWAADQYTATIADLESSGHHAGAPAAVPPSRPWVGHVTGIASEWSPEFPGYVAGAVDAATRGVARVVAMAEASQA